MSIKVPSHSLIAFARLSFLTRLPEYVITYGVLLLVTLALRLMWLNQVPVAITHDEVFYANQARALSISGTDLSATWSPLSLTSSHPLFAEWPGVVMVPGFWLFPNQPFLAYRFSYAVLGSVVPLLLAYICWQLFKKQKLSLIVFCLAAVNPWLFQVSRHGFDVLFTLVFYLAGLAVILGAKGYAKLWAAPILAIGFFQYQGGKVLLVPLLVLTAMYLVARARYEKGFERVSGIVSSVLLVIAGIGLTIWFWLHLSSQIAATRSSDVVLFNNAFLTQEAAKAQFDVLRNPFSRVVFNKGTILIGELYNQLVRSFDLVQLFVTGEPLRNPTTVWSHGLFYAIDAILIGIGLMWVTVDRRWRIQGLFVLSLAVVGTLPQVLNSKDMWIFLRLGLTYPMLIIMAALGFYFLWKYLKPNWFAQRLLIMMYLAGVGYFGYHYFMVAPVLATTDKYFAERVVASYAARLPENKKIEVLGDQSRFIFEEMIFYTKSITKESLPMIQQNMAKDELSVGNLTVSTSCYDESKVNDTVIIKDSSVATCGSDPSQVTGQTGKVLGASDLKSSVIRSPYSGENRFYVVNDELCGDNAAAINKRLDWQTIQVEELSDTDFCQAFIVKDR